MNGRVWSDAELATLKEIYPSRPSVEVAATLNRGLSGVYRMAQMKGLKKSAEFCASDLSGRLKKGETRAESVKHQFPKGHIPANKGMRSPGVSPGRMKETQFKRGERSGVAAALWKPVGTIVADPEGFLRIKIKERERGDPAGWHRSIWPCVHHQVWIEHHGPIPPKHHVAFKDRDRANCAIDNLELVSFAEMARRNMMWNRYPPELCEAIQLQGALKRKLRKLSGEEQDQRSAQPSL